MKRRPNRKMLKALLLNGVYDRQTLSLLYGSVGNASHNIKAALDEGYIRKRRVVARRGGKETVLTTLIITKAGIKYLADTEDEINATLSLREAVPELGVSQQEVRQPERCARQVRTNAVLTIAASAGASIPYCNYDLALWESEQIGENEIDEEDRKSDVENEDEDANQTDNDVGGRMNYLEYVRRNLTRNALQRFKLYNTYEDGDMIFHTAAVVKATAGQMNSLTSKLDFNRGRYSGIIAGETKSILLYAAPLFGMTWRSWFVGREVAAYTIWQSVYGRAPRGNDAESFAAMIVDMPRQFARLYKDLDKARSDESETFGEGFDHMYIIPLSTIGAEHLKTLLSVDDKEDNEHLADAATASGLYQRNNDATRHIFQLRNNDGCYTMIGVQLDARRMVELEQYARAYPEQKFCVLCLSWQVKYYESVMPTNVRYEIVQR